MYILLLGFIIRIVGILIRISVVWLWSVLNTCDDIKIFCNISLDTVEQHIDTKDSYIKRYNADVNNKITEWLIIHYFLPQTNKIISLVNRITGNDKINCYNAYNISIVSINNIVG